MLLTLLVTVILSVVVLEFNYLMRVHATLSGNMVENLRAEAAARAGVEKAKAMLLNDVMTDFETGLTADTLNEEWASEIKVETASTEAETRISDEMSKLNLNRLIKRPTTEYDIESLNVSMVESFRHLFELLEIDPNLVDCIVDWLDENDQEQPFGAENAYYESLDPPMKCKNGPMDSVEELLLVKGFDKKTLYGDDKNPGLADFVTVFGDEDGLVNINTAPEQVVAALLNSESLASTIVDMRQTSPFESAQDMAGRIPDVNLSEKFTTRSSYFLAESSGRVLSQAPQTEESSTKEPPTRDVKIRALLKRVHADEQQADHEYFSIDTAFWKVDR